MKLNRQNLLSFREYLAGLKPESFAMDCWFGYCGTTACLAGHAWRHFGNGKHLEGSLGTSVIAGILTEYCREKFGFSEEQAAAVFEVRIGKYGIRATGPLANWTELPAEPPMYLRDITLKEALHVWDRIIETDEVRPEFWQEARAESQREEKMREEKMSADPLPLAA